MYAGLNWKVLADNGANTTLVLDEVVTLTADSVTYSGYKDALIAWLRGNTILAEAVDSSHIITTNFGDNVSNYTGYVRILSVGDIYGTNPVPTNLSIDNSVITDCNICNVKNNYMLLTKKDASNAYSVIYNSSNEVYYLSTTNGILNVRPVITVVEY